MGLESKVDFAPKWSLGYLNLRLSCDLSVGSLGCSKAEASHNPVQLRISRM